MTAPVNPNLTAQQQRNLLTQLEALTTGRPVHTHTTLAGDLWVCASPYCASGNGSIADPNVPVPDPRGPRFI